MCGLNKVQKGDKHYIMRITKPKTTYEFANKMKTLLSMQSNKVTARTDYSAQRLSNFYMLKSDTLCDEFAIHGINHFITEKAWKKIKQLSNVDITAEPLNVERDDGKIVSFKPNYWKTQHNIIWEYDMPVSNDMLEIVKELEDLNAEEAGQAAELRELFWSIMVFLEGSLNKSKEHLGLDHEKSTISERTTHNTVPVMMDRESKKNKLFNALGM